MELSVFECLLEEAQVERWQLRHAATMTSKEYLEWCSWITRDSIDARADLPKQRFEL